MNTLANFPQMLKVGAAIALLPMRAGAVAAGYARSATTSVVPQICDISKFDSPDTFERPIDAGNVIAPTPTTVQGSDVAKVISVRTTGFDAAAATRRSAGVETGDVMLDSGERNFVGRVVTGSNHSERATAKTIISGSREGGRLDDFNGLMAPPADKLGASRAAPADGQFGRTGKIVGSQRYIAACTSGAIQHLAGTKDSRVVAATNKHPEAPILSATDRDLEEDQFSAVPKPVLAWS